MTPIDPENARALRGVLVALQQPVLDRRRAQWGESSTLHLAALFLLISAAEECHVKFMVIPPVGTADGVKVYGPRVDLFPENLRVGHPDIVERAAQILAYCLNDEPDMAALLVEDLGRSGEPDTRHFYQCATGIFRTVALAVKSETVL